MWYAAILSLHYVFGTTPVSVTVIFLLRVGSVYCSENILLLPLDQYGTSEKIETGTKELNGINSRASRSPAGLT